MYNFYSFLVIYSNFKTETAIKVKIVHYFYVQIVNYVKIMRCFFVNIVLQFT